MNILFVEFREYSFLLVGPHFDPCVKLKMMQQRICVFGMNSKHESFLCIVNFDGP